MLKTNGGVRIQGELEIDQSRGVIYFHLTNLKDIEGYDAITLLRICRLPAPIPDPINPGGMLDITHMHGVSWVHS